MTTAELLQKIDERTEKHKFAAEVASRVDMVEQGRADFEAFKALRAIKAAVEGLSFYESEWGPHQGGPIKAVNKFTQNRLNETRETAIKALEQIKQMWS